MSLERNRYGFDSEISFECDYCGEEEHTEKASFDAALDHIKQLDWRIKKDGKDWLHFCCDECLNEYDNSNGQFGVGA